MSQFFFYLFSTILILSAIAVISARNPVHSVLYLILAFINAGCLFITMSAEFLAMMIIIVYVGAVAVLFLFVVMMLDVDLKVLRRNIKPYIPLALTIGSILLSELLILAHNWESSAYHLATPIDTNVSNTQQIGLTLYTDYALIFQLVGMILLLAMVGAIVLTLRQSHNLRRQQVADQVSRQRHDAIAIHQVPVNPKETE